MNSNSRKGIILAGGFGTRLHPLTTIVSKQLLPVYNKPMIFYPLSVLMLAKIRNILIITDKKNLNFFKNLLGNGENLGIKISYETQDYPKGIAEAFLIGEKFIDNKPVALILGDNIFFGNNFAKELEKVSFDEKNSHIFLSHVKNPKDFGVAEIDKNLKVVSIKEKPNKPKSSYAVTGLYFYDKNIVKYAKDLKPSKRNELEITDLNNIYLKKKKLKAHILGRGFYWYDTGTFDNLLDASNSIKNLESNHDIKIALLEEIGFKNKWISKKQLKMNLKKLSKFDQNYLSKILKVK